jgi:hypothetical protein
MPGPHDHAVFDVLAGSPWLAAQPRFFRDKLFAAAVIQKVATGATLYNADVFAAAGRGSASAR